ncbi:MAG TPA: protein kinase [Feifaniaceae bacterium]|nr:protein kinase [Feifaniaceae bacterium]
MIGRILSGKYKIVSKIGSGGMADVYKAVQMGTLHRTVAVKILKPEYQTDASFVRRFEQEAQAVLNLSHEHIVRSYDVGTEGDLHYIVLEYVDGSTLKECIRAQGKFLPRSAINIGAQVLDALSHAHEQGIIHRDVKPQNIILNARGHVKLADFGIARNADSSTITYAGAMVMGSVHYISPEQAKGRQVTAESDIYSMGITLYEMVTGSLPFEGDNSVSIALRHIQEEIVPPIAIVPTLPPALNDVIMKAVSKQPSARYHSAKEMRQDLLRVLREPRGSFARQKTNEKIRQRRKQKSAGRKPRTVVWRITALGLMLLALFGMMMIMERTVLQRVNASVGFVPNLVGKTQDQAEDTARLRGYKVDIQEAESEDVPPGVVISQQPQKGAELKNGGVITITVSGGAAMPVVPEVRGMTLSEAEVALRDEGLLPGVPEYRISNAKVGTVFEQDPLPGTPLLPGDEVQLFISGEPSRSIEVPSVADLKLVQALTLLNERGFTAFRVRLASLDNIYTDTVMLQNPVSGEIASSTTMIELTASGIGEDVYSAQIAFTLDVEEDDTEILAIIPVNGSAVPYEQVVYEATLDAGKGREISFPAVIAEGGEHTLIVYRNGEEIRRTAAMFSYLR